MHDTGIVVTFGLIVLIIIVIVSRANDYYIEQAKQDAIQMKACIEAGNEWRRPSYPPFTMECVKPRGN